MRVQFLLDESWATGLHLGFIVMKTALIRGLAKLKDHLGSLLRLGTVIMLLLELVSAKIDLVMSVSRRRHSALPEVLVTVVVFHCNPINVLFQEAPKFSSFIISPNYAD